MLQPLPPRVQDHQPADGGPEPARIRRDLEQGGRGGAEEEVVHDALVRQREGREHRRHGEDDVDVADGQEFLLARRHPHIPRGRQALGTMPIPTAVVREARLRARLTAIAMAAQRRCAALDERTEDAPMAGREPRPVRRQKPIAVSAHDVGHLAGWPGHGCRKRRERAAVSGAETARLSSGFATACRCRCERCR